MTNEEFKAGKFNDKAIAKRIKNFYGDIYDTSNGIPIWVAHKLLSELLKEYDLYISTNIDDSYIIIRYNCDTCNANYEDIEIIARLFLHLYSKYKYVSVPKQTIQSGFVVYTRHGDKYALCNISDNNIDSEKNGAYVKPFNPKIGRNIFISHKDIDHISYVEMPIVTYKSYTHEDVFGCSHTEEVRDN